MLNKLSEKNENLWSDQREEFSPGLWVISEDSKHGTCQSLAVNLLNSTHHLPMKKTIDLKSIWERNGIILWEWHYGNGNASSFSSLKSLCVKLKVFQLPCTYDKPQWPHQHQMG